MERVVYYTALLFLCRLELIRAEAVGVNFALVARKKEREREKKGKRKRKQAKNDVFRGQQAH